LGDGGHSVFLVLAIFVLVFFGRTRSHVLALLIKLRLLGPFDIKLRLLGPPFDAKINHAWSLGLMIRRNDACISGDLIILPFSFLIHSFEKFPMILQVSSSLGFARRAGFVVEIP
jgi:hypothetical protein